MEPTLMKYQFYQMKKNGRVIIIGAGLSGLTLAYLLQQQNITESAHLIHLLR